MEATRKNLKSRLSIVLVVFYACSAIAATLIVYLQVFQKEEWEAKRIKSESEEQEVEADRGHILDCHGRPLATTVPSYEIRMDMNADGLRRSTFYKNVDSLAFCLSHLLGDKSAERYKTDLKNAFREGEDNRYYLVSRKRLSHIEYEEAKDFPLFRLGANTGGFIPQKIDERQLPFGMLAARTIGTFNAKEKRGIVGLENAFNEELKGIPGTKIRKRVSGRWISVTQKEPISGKNIKTTINIDFQDIVETALFNQVSAYQPEFGTAILMEVKTGDIKAIANLGRTSSGSYWENYNYGLGQLVEPGSTFKLASIMVALEDGVIDLDDTIDAGNGKFKYFNATLSDSRRGGYGKISVREVFEHSSNIGITKIIYNNYKNDPKKFIDRLYAMSLNEPLNIGIKGEQPPYIKYPDSQSWSGISLPWMAMGYEIALLPIHTLTFYNAVANNGKMVRPRIVTDIMQGNNSVKHFKTQLINPSICSRKTIRQAQELLEGVVKNGTAKNLNETYLEIAGKTGTARVANNNQGYGGQDRKYNYRASFCGYFPAKNPKYSCIVLVDSPTQKGIYGNVVAGTVFREIADKIYAQSYDLQTGGEPVAEKTDYRVPLSLNGKRSELMTVFSYLDAEIKDAGRKEEWVETQNQRTHIELKNKIIEDNVMPSVKGMGAKDAVFLLESQGLVVELDGYGTVRKQSIPKGTRIKRGTRIKLMLS